MIDTCTESLCPWCLRRIPARRHAEGDEIYLMRNCPEHGEIKKVLIWRNSHVPFDVWTKPRTGACCATSSCNCRESTPVDPDLSIQPNCPYDCGICQKHRQHTCSALVEVTARCNLSCPICFADTPEKCDPDPDIAEIENRLRMILDSAGNCPIQLSGGEPTARDDLPEIIRRAHALGFDHIQINTNGLRVAEDFNYARDLRDAGATDFFLQFDGVTDDVYLKIRGRSLFALKEAAVRNAAELRVAVILVPTLVKGVNDSQIGAILQFAKQWMPTIRGVHFQPMTRLGRYPHSPQQRSPDNADRIIIPDLLAAIVDQTGGEISVENFIPSACEDPRCSFTALTVLHEDGRLIPTTHIDWASARGEDAAEKSIAYVRRHWSYPAPIVRPIVRKMRKIPTTCTEPTMDTPKNPVDKSASSSGRSMDTLLERVRNYSLCISGMAFQDVWNIELDRLQRCCIHVAESDANLVPFCAYYLTGADGRRLRMDARVTGRRME